MCQEQLIEAGKLVAKSVEGCVDASQGATNDEGLLKQVGAAATGVNQALNELLQHIKQYASGGHPIGRHGEATDRILDVTENIFSSMGDAGMLFVLFIVSSVRRMLWPRLIIIIMVSVLMMYNWDKILYLQYWM